jgi:RsiW-degrading membrane proteinase PrsW (M82 family)
MNYILNFPLTLFFAVLPSFAWLNYYLRKDVKPEPKSMILKVFFAGMCITLPTIFVENFFLQILENLNFNLFLKIFLGVAIIEELLKFLVVLIMVFPSPELEEPVDTLIYMIVAALGFAAAENIFLLTPKGTFSLKLIEISFLRFLGATFLHALSSAVVGFYIGLSFFRKKERKKLISFGIFLASLLHGFYNFSIIRFGGNFGVFLAAILLLISACFVSFSFKKLKE